MFNNFNKQENTGGEQEAGSKAVFNQFVAPVTSDEIRPKKDKVRIFLAVSLVLAIALAVGAYFYLGFLSNQVEMKKAELTQYDSTPNAVQFENNLPGMKILSQRIKLLNTVHDSKLYLSGMLFPVLESVVESSPNSYVYFNKFNLKKNNNSNLSSVTISGMALDYPTLYRQLNNFKNEALSGFIFNFKLNTFSLNEAGTLNFDISFDIDVSTQSFLKYINTNIINSSSTNPYTVNSGPLFDIIPDDVDIVSTSTNPASETATSTDSEVPSNNTQTDSSSTASQKDLETTNSQNQNQVEREKDYPIFN